MNLNEQRKLGVVLAAENNAPKTLKIIKNVESSYPEIFKSAAAELGPERLAEIILEQEDPEFALAMINNVSGIGELHDKLTKLADQMHQSIVRPEADVTDAALAEIGNLSLSVKVGASFSASFTMYWSPLPGVLMPALGYPGQTPPYKWSRTIPIAQSQSHPCSFFALDQAKLAEGATVWMVVWAHGVGLYQTSYRFTYTGSALTAKIQADGGLVGASFTLLGVE